MQILHGIWQRLCYISFPGGTSSCESSWPDTSRLDLDSYLYVLHMLLFETGILLIELHKHIRVLITDRLQRIGQAFLAAAMGVPSSDQCGGLCLCGCLL